MDFTLLIAAFGGGVLATMMGGIMAFIFTGLTVLAAVLGGVIGGVPSIGLISFGSVFGPHVAFGGAVAGAAYAMTKNHIENGQDIVTPLVKFADPMMLIIGGIFGIVGFLIQYLVGPVLGGLAFEGILGAGNGGGWTDSVALTVALSGIIVRLVFGKTGITGKTPTGENRAWVPSGNRLAFILTYGLGIGIVFGGAAGALGVMGATDELALNLFNNINIIAFGIAAVSLILLPMGHHFEGWHHIGLPAATTAMIMFTATANPFMAIVGGAITGMIGAFVGEWAAMTFNSHADTHIDPPGITIFLIQTVNFVILGGLIFG